MIGKAAISAMCADAAERAPQESCGLVIHDEYHACDNIADDPVASFRITPKVVFDAQRAGTLQAIIHSHPYPHPAAPSHADMIAQLAQAVPFGIVPVAESGEPGEPFFWGADTPRPALLGRPYRHGVTDCYAVCRDYYQQEHDLDLPDYARGWGWWHAPDCPDLYAKHFAGAGFESIDPALAALGDGVLIAVGHRGIISHAGVIVEPGVILHHPAGDRPYDPVRLSRRDALARWLPHVRHVVRHRDITRDRAGA